jgi:DNA-binding CsgD family transcriptional regulator
MLRISAIGELRRALRFDHYVWVLTDPVTSVGVDPLADVPGVTDLAMTIRLKYSTAVSRWTAIDGVAVLGEHAAESHLWREVQQPLGVADVASVVFRDRYGCWGFLDLWLRDHLRPDQRQLLESVGPALTTALRVAQAATLRQLPIGAPEAPRPATLLMDDKLQVTGSTAGMDDRLRRLLPNRDGVPPVPAAALNVAAQLLAVEDGVDSNAPEARTPLGDGRWVAVRAARLRPSGLISVSAEPTTPAERLDLCVRAFGLSQRETDIVRAVARGLDTAQIAAELHLAPYTVQDHLKSVFAKAGVGSRRELGPMLAG